MNAGSTEQGILIETYIRRVLRKGTPYPTVFKLCKKAGVDETAFYAHFPNLDAVAASAWLQPLNAAHEIVAADEEFEHFGLHNKIVSLLYTTLEQATAHRSFMLQAWPGLDVKSGPLRDQARAYKQVVMPWIEQAVADGTIARRAAGPSVYARVFSAHYILVLDFWLKDESNQFERTDAFVEKTVTLAMDLIGKQAFDSALDLARFIASCRR